MSRDSDTYFAHYSQQFKPTNRTLEDWIQRKRNALENAEYIKVLLTEISIDFSPDSPDLAAVEFSQAYASDSFQGNTRKRLDLKNSPDGWLIVAETNINQ